MGFWFLGVRVFAMEGAVNAGYGVIGQSILLLRNAWVLQVFKEQSLILAVLLGLSAFSHALLTLTFSNNHHVALQISISL